MKQRERGSDKILLHPVLALTRNYSTSFIHVHIFLSHDIPVHTWNKSSLDIKHDMREAGMGVVHTIVQELCESRGGRPGLSVLTSLMVSVDVKRY